MVVGPFYESAGYRDRPFDRPTQLFTLQLKHGNSLTDFFPFLHRCINFISIWRAGQCAVEVVDCHRKCRKSIQHILYLILPCWKGRSLEPISYQSQFSKGLVQKHKIDHCIGAMICGRWWLMMTLLIFENDDGGWWLADIQPKDIKPSLTSRRVGHPVRHPAESDIQQVSMKSSFLADISEKVALH